MVKNSAFVFIKPHAVTEKVKDLVKETFEKKGIAITKEGLIEAEEIDTKMLIDQHYYAIAAKATILTPDKLDVPAEKFKDKFDVEWKDVLASGAALNAKQACEKFDVDAAGLEAMWAACKKAGNLIKLGGGFYCGKLEPEGKGTFYVFNAFFMSMRSKFVAPGVAIYYYVVEWDSSTLPWEDFRGQVLGPTDPAEAPAESLRGAILAKWKELDLKSEPNTGDNGVHASASPFEALAERMNWLGIRVERDPFGKLLLKTGVTRKQIKEWTVDPQVTYGPIAITKSLFDSLEDTDSDMCLALCQMIGGHCGPKEASGDLEKEVERLKAQIELLKPIAEAVAAIQSFVPLPPPKPEKEPKKAKAKKEKPEPEVPPPAPKKEKGKGKGKVPLEEDEGKPPMRKGKGGGKSGGKGKGGKGKGKGKGKGY